LLDALGRVLAKDFPNPERVGCPSRDLLRALASRQLSLAEAEPWMDHLGKCSPCFRDYTELRRLIERRRKLTYLGIAAVIVMACVALWGWRSRQQAVITAHNHIVADMRNRLVLRGDQGPGKGPLVFDRGFDDVSFYLPEGSRAGTYEVAIFREEPGEPLTIATGTATIENGTTAMNVTLDLSRIPPGYYLVGIRLPGTDWGYSPLIVK
jgi:hypothetical protein